MGLESKKRVERFLAQMQTIRADNGLSQSELARLSAKTPGYICDMERGRRTPNLSTVLQIADALGAEVVIRKIPEKR